MSDMFDGNPHRLTLDELLLVEAMLKGTIYIST
jgi:hypothetical protein